jgi:hypothetical protein
MDEHIERNARLLRNARDARDGYLANSRAALDVAQNAFDRGEFALAKENLHEALQLRDDAVEQDVKACEITGDRVSNTATRRKLDNLGAGIQAIEDRFAFVLGGGRRTTVAKHKHKGRSYTVRTGPRGGRYIVVKGDKVYI